MVVVVPASVCGEGEGKREGGGWVKGGSGRAGGRWCRRDTTTHLSFHMI